VFRYRRISHALEPMKDRIRMIEIYPAPISAEMRVHVLRQSQRAFMRIPDQIPQTICRQFVNSEQIEVPILGPIKCDVDQLHQRGVIALVRFL
jgi:hypothetical protein